MTSKTVSSEAVQAAQAAVLKDQVMEALADIKAEGLVVLDVQDKTLITRYMVVASGRSDRHVHAIAKRVFEQMKAGQGPKCTQERSRDWVLLDLGDVIVHVMLPETREIYGLEKLWSVTPSKAMDSVGG